MVKIGVFLFTFLASFAHSAQLDRFVTWDKNPTPPALNVTNLSGQEVKLSDFSNQVVIINFWATWCAPCIKEIPSLLSLKKQLPEKKFTVLFVNYGETKERVQKHWGKIGQGETTLIDPGGIHTKPWIDIGLPTTVVLNQKHQIIYKIVGDLDWSHADVVSIIKRLDK